MSRRWINQRPPFPWTGYIVPVSVGIATFMLIKPIFFLVLGGASGWWAYRWTLAQMHRSSFPWPQRAVDSVTPWNPMMRYFELATQKPTLMYLCSRAIKELQETPFKDYQLTQGPFLKTVKSESDVRQGFREKTMEFEFDISNGIQSCQVRIQASTQNQEPWKWDSFLVMDDRNQEWQFY